MVSLEKLFGRVKAERDVLDTQLIMFVGSTPFSVFNLQSFVRLQSWDGTVIDVLVMPNGEGICLSPGCGGFSPCVHVEALQLHGLLPRVPTPPKPDPRRPITRPASNGHPVAAEGRPT